MSSGDTGASSLVLRYGPQEGSAIMVPSAVVTLHWAGWWKRCLALLYSSAKSSGWPLLMHRIFCGLFLAAVLAISPWAYAARFVIPEIGDIGGGTVVTVSSPTSADSRFVRIYFNGRPATDYVSVGSFGVECRTPPQDTAGPASIVIEYPRGNFWAPVEGQFTYVDRPNLLGLTPQQHSVSQDQVVVSLFAYGFSVQPGTRVYFGEQEASDVKIKSYDGTEINCVAPQFPGGAFPRTVDLRVVSPGGGESTLPQAFTYQKIVPVIRPISLSYNRPWRTGQPVILYSDYTIAGSGQVYFDGIPALNRIREGGTGGLVFDCTIPPHAPGIVDVTVVNGDGGIYVLKNGFRYGGTPSTDFHTADQDHNFRLSLSEILRAIQYFNSDGFHCDATTEDGYALGSGEQTCAPHASDYDPQDWQISLPELLQLIQFYNLFCYEPCTTDPSGYCPPIDYRESRG